MVYYSTAPSAPPQNVTATAVSSTEIVVLWEEVPAIDENGVITMYEIQFVPLETFNGQITSDTVNTSNGSILMMVLTGLEEYVEYNISVRAYTSAGPGPYSVGVVERTPTAGREIYVVLIVFHTCFITLYSTSCTFSKCSGQCCVLY